MNSNYLAKATIIIDAPKSKVWEALTKPELIKQYLFGTEVTTNWRVGSPIVYKGIWEGKAYEDKGKVLEEEAKHSEQNWNMVLEGMKALLENRPAYV